MNKEMGIRRCEDRKEEQEERDVGEGMGSNKVGKWITLMRC